MAALIDLTHTDFIQLSPGSITNVSVENAEGIWHFIPPNSPFIVLQGSPSGETHGSAQVFQITVPAHAPPGVSTAFRLEGGGRGRVIQVRVVAS
jgi:hypothetical protein